MKNEVRPDSELVKKGQNIDLKHWQQRMAITILIDIERLFFLLFNKRYIF